MRLLFLIQGHTVKDQPGYDDGFKRLMSEKILDSYQTIPYYGYIKEHGYEAFYKHAFAVAKKMEANAIFLQFPHGFKVSPSVLLEKLRFLPSNPTIFTSNGDPFGPLLHPPPAALLEAAKSSDVTFSTGMGRFATHLKQYSVQNIVLMPNGHCQVRFEQDELFPLNKPEFEIVYIGSRTCSRNPLKRFFWVDRKRKELVDLLTQRYGKKFAIFGHGWTNNPSWHGPIPYNAQGTVNRMARLVFGGFPNATTDYYSSDRLFIALASGVPVVDFWVPRIDRIFKNNEHLFLFKSKDEIIPLLDRLLAEDDSLLQKVGSTAAKLCRKQHSQYNRTKAMIEIVSQVRKAKMTGVKAPLPKLDFFHDQVKLEDEYPYAVCNWG